MSNFKTRYTDLLDGLKAENFSESKIVKIVKLVDKYEKNNINVINKLKREKKLYTKRIAGALRQTITAHGSITEETIGSATKRIYGALLGIKKNNTKIHVIYSSIILILLGFCLFY